MAGTARRAGWLIAVAAPLAVAGLAGPDVIAADDHVTGSTVSSAVTSAVPPAAPGTETGPVLLLLVAGTLGVLGVLSGPEGESATRPTQRTHEHTR